VGVDDVGPGGGDDPDQGLGDGARRPRREVDAVRRIRLRAQDVQPLGARRPDHLDAPPGGSEAGAELAKHDLAAPRPGPA